MRMAVNFFVVGQLEPMIGCEKNEVASKQPHLSIHKVCVFIIGAACEREMIYLKIDVSAYVTISFL